MVVSDRDEDHADSFINIDVFSLLRWVWQLLYGIQLVEIFQRRRLRKKLRIRLLQRNGEVDSMDFCGQKISRLVKRFRTKI